MTLYEFLNTREDSERVIVWCDWESYFTDPDEPMTVGDLKQHEEENKQMKVDAFHVGKFYDDDPTESLIIDIYNADME